MANFQTNSRGAGKKYKWYHRGGEFTKRCNLDRHIRQLHAQSFTCQDCGKECTRSKNLEMHMRTCTGSSTPAHRGGAAFIVQRKRRALGGAVEVHSVDMDAANQMVALEDAIVALGPTMVAYQRRHHA